VKLEQLGK
jgi:hypothetical protein